MKTWTRILTSTATATWVAAGLFTILLVYGTPYLLRGNAELFDLSTKMHIEQVRQELTGAKMPPDQVTAVVDAMRDMKGDVADHVGGTASTLQGMIMLMWLFLLGVLSTTKLSQHKGTPE